jgi:hypothetical protein
MTSLTSEQIKRKNELMGKLHNRLLNPVEAEELRQLLEIEKQNATSGGDILKALGIILLIGLVIAVIASDKK